MNAMPPGMSAERQKVYDVAKAVCVLMRAGRDLGEVYTDSGICLRNMVLPLVKNVSVLVALPQELAMLRIKMHALGCAPPLTVFSEKKSGKKSEWC